MTDDREAPTADVRDDPWYPGGQRDASLWVEEFFRIYPNGCDDADTMLGWFANAIETGVMFGARGLVLANADEGRETLAAVNKAIDYIESGGPTAREAGLATLRSLRAALAASGTGEPCAAHKQQGFVYTVMGCPRCYPALAASGTDRREYIEDADYDVHVPQETDR